MSLLQQSWIAVCSADLQIGVLEKRDGMWVHVLMHGSYPVDEVPLEIVKRYYGDSIANPDGETDEG